MMTAGFFLIVPALLAGALVWIQIQNNVTRTWRETEGVITVSQSEARTVRTFQTRDDSMPRHPGFTREEKLETRNFARIGYEFNVDGRFFKGSRIDLSVVPDPNISAILRKYRVGQGVTVIYDPADPTQCILERDDPKKVRAGWVAVCVLVALIGGIALGGERFGELLQGKLRRPEFTPLVVVLGLCAVMLASFARIVGRKGREMRTWPMTVGKIVESAVAQTRFERSSGNWSRWRRQTLYVPRVVYRYSVGGTSLDGDQIGAVAKSSRPSAAETCVAAFPIGMAVDVFYNPILPAESTLDRSVGWVPLVLAILSALLIGAAFAIAGIF
jgi:hypothetical protein